MLATSQPLDSSTSNSMPKQAPKSKGASRTASSDSTGGSFKFFIFGILVGIGLTLLTQQAIRSNTPETKAPKIEPPPKVVEPPAEPPAENGPAIDFYTRLRDTEVLVPEAQQIEPRKEKVYFIQAASFRNKADADRARAQLILLNLETNITEFNSGTEIWHRIMVGPFRGQSLLSKAQTILLENGYGGMVLERSK